MQELIADLSPAVRDWLAGHDLRLERDTDLVDLLLSAARENGADLVLSEELDERFEPGLGDRIGLMTGKHTPPVIWSFRIRDADTRGPCLGDALASPTRQPRLFPVYGNILVRRQATQWRVSASFHSACGVGRTSSFGSRLR